MPTAPESIRSFDIGRRHLAGVVADGKKIAFMSDRTAHYEIYTVNAAGGGRRQITHTDGGAHDPSWSPDGKKIAFATFVDGQWQIDVVNSGGGAVTQLTSSNGDNTNPAWSPDSKKIAFESTRDNESKIFVMGADGSSQHALLTTVFRSTPIPSTATSTTSPRRRGAVAATDDE